MSKIDKTKRFEIIIREINYWKSHKLLPESYCDYLLALYTNGESDTVPESTLFQKTTTTLHCLLSFLLLPFSFLVIYFTKFAAVLQLGILILFMIYAFWCYNHMKKYKNRIYPFILVVALLILLLFSVFLGNVIMDHIFVTMTIITVNFIIWFYIGLKGNVVYLKIASIIGIVFSVFYTIL